MLLLTLVLLAATSAPPAVPQITTADESGKVVVAATLPVGAAVNLESRIETLHKPFRTDILISQDSYDIVRDTFNVEAMPAIKVKGKTEPQTIYAVLGRKDDPACPANMDIVREMLGFETGSVADVDPDAKEEKFEVIGK